MDGDAGEGGPVSSAFLCDRGAHTALSAHNISDTSDPNDGPLRIAGVDCEPWLERWERWLWLEQLPCLSSLAIADTGAIEAKTILPTVLRCCPKLAQLDVSSPALYLSDFVRAFATPVMRQLQSLTLRHYFGGLEWCDRRVAPTAEELTAGFAGMTCLRTLTLDRTNTIDPLLPFVVHAPVLTLLTLIVSNNFTENSCPSAAVLRGVLALAPALHCTVRAIGKADPHSSSGVEELTAIKQFGQRLLLMR